MNKIEVIFSLEFKVESKKWKARNPKIAAKVGRLMFEIIEHPFEGIGKPEKLVNSTLWSRRIDRKHRLVYEVVEGKIIFISCYGHYGDH